MTAAAALALTAACERKSSPAAPSVPPDTPAQAPQSDPPGRSEDAQITTDPLPPPPVGEGGTAPPSAAPSAASAQPTDDWRALASAEDQERMSRLPVAWTVGLNHISPADAQPLGNLVDPKIALPRPQPTPGSYRCRTIKLGKLARFIAYDWFRCTVELTPGGDLVLRKTTGSQRTEGLLYPGEGNTLVYLGGQSLGDEKGAPRYGQSPERDQIGQFTRIGPDHYRLALPWPKVESNLDLIELVRD